MAAEDNRRIVEAFYREVLNGHNLDIVDRYMHKDYVQHNPLAAQGSAGFIEFHLLRGPAGEDHTLYASHTVWRSRADFENWTKSEAFRKAHANAGDHRKVYLGHPEFEGFEVVAGA